MRSRYTRDGRLKTSSLTAYDRRIIRDYLEVCRRRFACHLEAGIVGLGMYPESQDFLSRIMMYTPAGPLIDQAIAWLGWTPPPGPPNPRPRYRPGLNQSGRGPVD